MLSRLHIFLLLVAIFGSYRATKPKEKDIKRTNDAFRVIINDLEVDSKQTLPFSFDDLRDSVRLMASQRIKLVKTPRSVTLPVQLLNEVAIKISSSSASFVNLAALKNLATQLGRHRSTIIGNAGKPNPATADAILAQIGTILKPSSPSEPPKLRPLLKIRDDLVIDMGQVKVNPDLGVIKKAADSSLLTSEMMNITTHRQNLVNYTLSVKDPIVPLINISVLILTSGKQDIFTSLNTVKIAVTEPMGLLHAISGQISVTQRQNLVTKRQNLITLLAKVKIAVAEPNELLDKITTLIGGDSATSLRKIKELTDARALAFNIKDFKVEDSINNAIDLCKQESLLSSATTIKTNRSTTIIASSVTNDGKALRKAIKALLRKTLYSSIISNRQNVLKKVNIQATDLNKTISDLIGPWNELRKSRETEFDALDEISNVGEIVAAHIETLIATDEIKTHRSNTVTAAKINQATIDNTFLLAQSSIAISILVQQRLDLVPVGNNTVNGRKIFQEIEALVLMTHRSSIITAATAANAGSALGKVIKALLRKTLYSSIIYNRQNVLKKVNIQATDLNKTISDLIGPWDELQKSRETEFDALTKVSSEGDFIAANIETLNAVDCIRTQRRGSVAAASIDQTIIENTLFSTQASITIGSLLGQRIKIVAVGKYTVEGDDIVQKVEVLGKFKYEIGELLSGRRNSVKAFRLLRIDDLQISDLAKEIIEWIEIPSKQSIVSLRSKTFYINKLETSVSHLLGDIIGHFPLESTDDAMQVFLKVLWMANNLKNMASRDAIFLQLQQEIELDADESMESIFSLVILLRLLESFQASIYSSNYTVSAPIFKIWNEKEKTIENISELSKSLQQHLQNKFPLEKIFRLEQSLRYIVDIILKGRCHMSIFQKVSHGIIKEICEKFKDKEIKKIIQPYQELPPRKCKYSQFQPLKKVWDDEHILCRYSPGKDDEDAERYVIVKIYPKENDEARVIDRELMHMVQNSYHSELKGSYLVGNLCTFQTIDYVFVAMDLLSEVTLENKIDELKKLSEGKFDEDLLRKYAAQIILAISDLHSRGIVHVSVTPKNIVLDNFGNARLLISSLSEPIASGNKTYHSNSFQPPEMHNGDSYGLEVDWYGFDCVTFKLCSSNNFNITQTILGENQEKISKEGQSLIKRLLNSDKNARLINVEDIKKDQWFKSVDWITLENEAPKLLAPQNLSKDNKKNYSELEPPEGTRFDNIKSKEPDDYNVDQFLFAKFGELPANLNEINAKKDIKKIFKLRKRVHLKCSKYSSDKGTRLISEIQKCFVLKSKEKWTANPDINAILVNREKTFSVGKLQPSLSLLFKSILEQLPVESNDDAAKVFLYISRTVEINEDLKNFLNEDPILKILIEKVEKYPSPSKYIDYFFSLVILIRFVESLEIYLYHTQITVPAPLFKIYSKDSKVLLWDNISYLGKNLIHQIPLDILTPYFVIQMEHKLRYIIDFILEGQCDQSILLKSPSEVFNDLCTNLAELQLANDLKPYLKLPPRKCKMSQFEPIKELGSGAYGQVYLCRYTPRKDDPEKEVRYVAVKTMKKSPKDSKDQSREVKYLALNNSSNSMGSYLVGTYCTFQSEEHVFIVMDLLSGGSLADKIKENYISKSSMNEHQTRKHAAQIFLAINELHTKGIVHRDVKPANIMLDDFNNALLVDYGLSKNIGLKKIKESFNEPYPYFPPEMYTMEYGIEIDWYGFGVTLAQCFLTNFDFLPTDPSNTKLNDIEKLKTDLKGKVSDEGIDFISQLVISDKKNRLTNPVKIKNHSWFRNNNINWKELQSNAPKMFALQDLNKTSQYSSLPRLKQTPFDDAPKDKTAYDTNYLRFN